MRVALVAHGFPPYERTGVENYTAALARALARAGVEVVVFAPRRAALPELSTRREERDGYAIEWLTSSRDPAGPDEMLDRPDVTRVFGRFLEHERPDLVHFQHVYKVGVGLLEEVRRRGLPCVYTAHDYYPVCHRYTLLRPDLAHCEIRGDPMVCALCDLALGYLNGIPGLGDYQMGVLPDQLAESQRQGLAALLDDDPVPAKLDREAVDAAFDRRLALDARRARAFQAPDVIIAPTRFLAAELVRGGLDRERIEVLPYGIENADLAALPPVRLDPGAPVRFAYFGGLSKHKGVHVLLEAFRRLRAPAELSIWGYSTDAPYVERLRRLSEESRVLWHGGYERRELPGLMADVDVVVVPSIWVENYPIVIREAFSARRPVIASRFGAIEESVRHGVDGLLFERGDAGALAAALERCIVEPGLIAELARGVQPVKSIDEQARELLERYRALLERRAPAAASAPAPASLTPHLERHARLAALPTRELLSRVLQGIGALQRGLGGEVAATPVAQLLASGVGHASDARDELRERRAQAAWLEETLAAARAEPGRAEVRREADWLRGLVEERARELAWRVEGQAELQRLLAAACAEAGSDAFDHAADRPAAHYAFDLVELLVGERDAAPERLARLLLERAGGARARPAGGAPLSGARDVERDELAWRRGEMAAAARLSPRGWLRFLLSRTALGRRLAAWRTAGSATPGGGA